jgi:hypothetical protein
MTVVKEAATAVVVVMAEVVAVVVVQVMEKAVAVHVHAKAVMGAVTNAAVGKAMTSGGTEAGTRASSNDPGRTYVEERHSSATPARPLACAPACARSALQGQGEKARRREKTTMKDARKGMGWGKMRGTEGRRGGPVATPGVGAGPHPKGQRTQQAAGA